MKNALIIVLLVVVVVFVVGFLSMGGSEKALGKAKKKAPATNTQQKIDFKTPANGGKTKLEALDDLLNVRIKQKGALVRAKRDNDPALLDKANQLQKEAKKKENYLNTNYTLLKGACKCDVFK